MRNADTEGAIVRKALSQRSRERGEDYELLLVRYANERFLYRLSISPYVQLFVLKGATLLSLWGCEGERATRDIDLLGFGAPDLAIIEAAMAAICAIHSADGVTFDPRSVRVDIIRALQEYGGLRVTLQARITTAKIKVQIDIGFGDAITPEMQMMTLPPLLPYPPAVLNAYPRETVVAEKVDAAINLGAFNSRMKDYYDLCLMSRRFNFEGANLVNALRATLSRRQTPTPDGWPVGLSKEFADIPGKAAQWSGFLRKSKATSPGTLSEVLVQLEIFLAPVINAMRSGGDPGWWKPPGPWRRNT